MNLFMNACIPNRKVDYDLPWCMHHRHIVNDWAPKTVLKRLVPTTYEVKPELVDRSLVPSACLFSHYREACDERVRPPSRALPRGFYKPWSTLTCFGTPQVCRPCPLGIPVSSTPTSWPYKERWDNRVKTKPKKNAACSVILC
jgi:hypothetical protein